MGIVKSFKKFTHRPLVGAPLECRHLNYSVIASLDDDPAKPNDRLFDLALDAVSLARQFRFTNIEQRLKNHPEIIRSMFNTWPGEHYRLLAGVLQSLQPKTIVEIGTYTGLSALAMLEAMPAGSRLITYDIIPWDQLPGTALNQDDFASGRITQHIADLAKPDAFAQHTQTLQQADLFFIDGPKDAKFEQAFLNNLATIDLPAKPVLLLDDIRVWNMLKTWRNISRPKLDLTSFGHWSGTGLVDWS